MSDLSDTMEGLLQFAEEAGYSVACGGFGEVGVPHVPHHKECPDCARWGSNGWTVKDG